MVCVKAEVSSVPWEHGLERLTFGWDVGHGLLDKFPPKLGLEGE